MDKETAIQKRNNYIAQTDGLINIFDDFTKLCDRYGLTPKQFLELAAPVYEDDEEVK